MRRSATRRGITRRRSWRANSGCGQRHDETGFPVTIVRPSHTYSKRWIPNAISSGSYTFAARLEQGKPVFVHDDGESPWTLTAAEDFAVGLAGLVGNEEAIGEAFHITSDEVLTWNEIYAEIVAALGGQLPADRENAHRLHLPASPAVHRHAQGRQGPSGVFDNSKIKRFVPDFRCRKPFRVGVRESVAWLRAHPEQQNRKPELDEMIEKVVAAYRESLKSKV